MEADTLTSQGLLDCVVRSNVNVFIVSTSFRCNLKICKHKKKIVGLICEKIPTSFFRAHIGIQYFNLLYFIEVEPISFIKISAVLFVCQCNQNTNRSIVTLPYFFSNNVSWLIPRFYPQTCESIFLFFSVTTDATLKSIGTRLAFKHTLNLFTRHSILGFPPNFRDFVVTPSDPAVFLIFSL